MALCRLHPWLLPTFAITIQSSPEHLPKCLLYGIFWPHLNIEIAAKYVHYLKPF